MLKIGKKSVAANADPPAGLGVAIIASNSIL